MPVWNQANNIKRGGSQVIKMLRGGNSPWAAYNAATGGTESTIVNYNGSGETWKVHLFTGNGTLSVTQAVGVFPFRVLWVGAGGASSGFNPYHGASGGGGGAGRVVNADNYTLSVSAHAVTVGAAGAGQVNGASQFYSQTAPGGGSGGGAGGGGGSAGGSGGGGGGSHGPGGSGGAAVPGTPLPGYGTAGGNAPTGGMASQSGGNAGGSTGSGAGYTSNITGADVVYGRGGNVGATGGGTYGSAGLSPAGGVVIVAYRIA